MKYEDVDCGKRVRVKVTGEFGTIRSYDANFALSFGGGFKPRSTRNLRATVKLDGGREVECKIRDLEEV